MKHSLKITLSLIFLFICAQAVGLLAISQHIPHQVTTEEGIVVIKNETAELAFNTQRPEVESQISAVGLFVGAILVGTIILLVIIKFKKRNIWKTWFFLAVTLSVTYAIASFPILSNPYNWYLALAIALTLAYLKIIKKNVIIHNISEVFIYAGLAVLFVPMQYMTVVVGFVLLALISLYDMFAVWQSRHMIKLANFQTDSKVFAGLYIPYSPKKSTQYKDYKKDKDHTDIKETDNSIISNKSSKQEKSQDKLSQKSHQKKVIVKQNAILGGGDIAFPLIFAGIVMKDLMLLYPQLIAFSLTFIISFAAAIALLLLFIKAEKGKFYPAMPFVTIGCASGYLIVFLITLLL